MIQQYESLDGSRPSAISGWSRNRIIAVMVVIALGAISVFSNTGFEYWAETEMNNRNKNKSSNKNKTPAPAPRPIPAPRPVVIPAPAPAPVPRAAPAPVPRAAPAPVPVAPRPAPVPVAPRPAPVPVAPRVAPAPAPRPAPAPAPAPRPAVAPKPVKIPTNTGAGGKSQEPEVMDHPIPQPTCETPPYVVLGEPTGSSIRMKLYSDAQSAVRIFYRPLTAAAAQYMEAPAPAGIPARRPVEVDINNLSPGINYAYTIMFQNVVGGQECPIAQTREHSFATAKPPGVPFQFAVVADIHIHDDGSYFEDIFRSTLSQIDNEKTSGGGIDFVVDIGDTFMGGKPELAYTPATVEKPYQDIFRLYSEVCKEAPLFLANGNHDFELGWEINGESSMPVICQKYRQEYFMNPSRLGSFYRVNQDVDFASVGPPGNYYAWEWGDAQMIVLDPFWYTMIPPKHNPKREPWTWTLGDDQYEWLHQTLSSSNALYKFVFIHHVTGGVFGTPKEAGGGGAPKYSRYFEWGGYEPSGEYNYAERRPGWTHGSIHEMLVKYGGSVVFRGHDHLYFQEPLDSVVYNTVMKPSVAYGDTGSPMAIEMADERGYPGNEVKFESGYMKVTVTDKQAIMTYVAYNGRIIDQYTVKPFRR